MSWEIIIKINDYYPKLDKIPYHECDCIISNNNNESLIPLKSIKSNNFITKLKMIESDLIFSIRIVNHKNKLLICKSHLIISYIKILQLYKKKTIKYEQYLKLFLENNIINKICGPSFSLKNIFIKFMIKINLINCNNSFSPNYLIFNNINNIKKNNSKNKIKNSSALDSTCSFGNISNLKIQETKNIHKSIEKKNISRNKINNVQITNHKFSSSYKRSSKNKNKSLYDKENKKKHHYFKSSVTPVKKLNKEEESNKNNTKYKKYGSQSHYKTYSKNNEKKDQLVNCLSERKEGKINDMKIKNQKKSLRKNFSVKDNLVKYYSIKIEFNKQKEKPKKYKSKSLITIISIENISNKNIINNNGTENTSSGNKNINSIKENKSFYNNKNTNPRDYNNYKIYENKLRTNEYQMDNKINFNENVDNQEEVENNYINIFEYFIKKNKELKQMLYIKINKLKTDYFIYREKLITENKQIYALNNQINKNDIKYFIHVKINSRFNNILFNKILNFQKRENDIIKILLHKKINQNKEQNNNINESKKLLQEKLKQQKQIHVLLKLIRDLINNYGNLSQLFENDKNKKILLKSLFLRYNIREKENQKKMELLDIYNKMVNEIKMNNNKNKTNKLKKEEFKAIKEENETEEDNNDEE